MADSSYRRLSSRPLPANTPVYRFLQGLPDRVRMDDPAVDVMTDLRRVKAVTVGPEALIHDALQKMILMEVRLLLVTGSDAHVVGLLTARDVLGEKPINLISRDRVSRDQIQVQDVMTPREQIEVLDLEDVYRARVGDVVATLRDRGRQHALVLASEDGGDTPMIRGVFSATQIGAQLGVEIPATGRVQSFAEVEALLNNR